jgi:hypothetical protein
MDREVRGAGGVSGDFAKSTKEGEVTDVKDVSVVRLVGMGGKSLTTPAKLLDGEEGLQYVDDGKVGFRVLCRNVNQGIRVYRKLSFGLNAKHKVEVSTGDSGEFAVSVTF